MPQVMHRATLEIRDSASEAEHPRSDWIHAPDLSGVERVPRHWWRIDGDTVREATAKEKLDAIEEHRARRIRELKIAVNRYGEAHYSERDEMRLSLRLEEAHRLGLANRAAFIQRAFAWRDAVLADYAQRYAALAAADTIEALDGVSMEFSAHDADDPRIDLTAALGVQD